MAYAIQLFIVSISTIYCALVKNKNNQERINYVIKI